MLSFISVFLALLIPRSLGIISGNDGNGQLGIIYGTTILPFSLPYLAFLKINGNPNHRRCGGALISQNYVLTAARCLDGTSSVKVVLGAFDISQEEEGQQSFVTSNFTIHYDFDNTTLENDIALIALRQPVAFSDHIQPIAIAKDEDMADLTGTTAETAGWGKQSTTSADSYSNVPLALFLKIIPNYHSNCDGEFGKLIQDTNICCDIWNSRDGPLNICEGDFGGPLVRNRNKLIGIASFTGEPCMVGSPNVFTGVVNYRTWLLMNSDAPLE